ncbi:MAG: hypothetical protein AAF495_25460 [Pseudomonadota bacterium]
MKWLITTQKCDLSEGLADLLAAEGCRLDRDEPPIPLGEDEQVIEVEGPVDLPDRLAHNALILKVSPSSDLTLY